MTRALLAVLLALMSACAPVSQVAGAPPVDFTGPRLEPAALVSFDGSRLPMTIWPATGAGGAPAEPWAVVVGLHGMDDYANAFVLAAPAWARDGITTYAYDQRGFGRGPHRGLWGGEALMGEDLRTAVALARAHHPRAVIAVVGESMGGAVAVSTFASNRPPAADRLVLVSPAVWGWSTQGPLNSAALWIAAHVAPTHRLEPPRWLTKRIRASDNVAILRRMGRDPNMIWGARIDAMYGLVDLMQHASDDMGGVRAPMLYLYGAHDEIIPEEAAWRAVKRLPPGARTAYYADGWHLLTRDLQAERVWRDVESFLRDAAAPLPSGAPPIPPPSRWPRERREEIAAPSAPIASAAGVAAATGKR